MRSQLFFVITISKLECVRVCVTRIVLETELGIIFFGEQEYFLPDTSTGEGLSSKMNHSWGRNNLWNGDHTHRHALAKRLFSLLDPPPESQPLDASHRHRFHSIPLFHLRLLDPWLIHSHRLDSLIAAFRFVKTFVASFQCSYGLDPSFPMVASVCSVSTIQV